LLWEAIPRVKESSSMFLIFNSRNISFAVPKHCIENAEDVTQLRELFRSEVETTQLRNG
jgi:YcxB-like protein